MEEQQQEFSATPYMQTTRQIRVYVVPEHIEEESDSSASVYAFSYKIKIENLGDERVQLFERHWIIFSGGRQSAEVVGPGVVGEQPNLDPADTFEYESSVVIHDPVGTMHGSYTFRTEGGEFFQVTIPQFDLLYPTAYH